jgi:uncharacterized protein YraI
MLMKRILGAAAILAASVGYAAAVPAVVATDLNVRSGPGTGFPVIASLPGGSTVEVIGCDGSWCRLAGGGYASRRYLSISAAGPAYYPYYYDEPYYESYYAPGYIYRRGWRHHPRPPYGDRGQNMRGSYRSRVGQPATGVQNRGMGGQFRGQPAATAGQRSGPSGGSIGGGSMGGGGMGGGGGGGGGMGGGGGGGGGDSGGSMGGPTMGR